MQLQTYLREFPMVFRFCVLTLATDGIDAKYGTPFTPLNHFAPWNVDDDGKPLAQPRIEDGVSVEPIDDALNGLFNQERFLQLVRNFTAFDENADGLTKRIAKPHQYFAVTKAVGSTVQAVETNGKAGVVWHTQGSGKSMEMELYTNLVSRHPKLKNPTVVVVTDRTELDGQLFQTFDQSLLLAEKPVQVRERAQLRDELRNRSPAASTSRRCRSSGSPRQKASARSTPADRPAQRDRRGRRSAPQPLRRPRRLRPPPARRPAERDAHRVHRHADLVRRARYARSVRRLHRHLRPPRAVDDGATVPVYFEPRLIKVSFAEGASEDDIDRAADEYTVGLDDTERARLEASVAVVNAVYGAPERIETLAADLVRHWEERRERMKPFLASPARRSSSAAHARSARDCTRRSSVCGPTGTPMRWMPARSRSSTRGRHPTSRPSAITCAATPRTRRSRRG
jgi:type I restriction enzyme R subunit